MAAAALLLLVGISALAMPAASAYSGEKETHIKVYWHDIAAGPSPTAVRVASAPSTNSSETFFGAVVVIDDPLTEGPNLTTSKLLGRAQGTYIGAGKDVLAFHMSMSFVFQAGAYNGSTVEITGRNQVLTDVREMAVVGGTGVLRFARGYVQARTQSLNANTGDATVEYNLFIRH